ncbi:hypothetical protein C4J81_06340 [Deltaproteobacteria bacterium Smac51]|nr:hypothetical protein C4J81_06340 [Deltaproteobacteria bacterium Smac51]
MYIKVFPHGQGGGDGPVNYLIRLDYPKRDESPPIVLRGDPGLTLDLIDALENKWKFSAGVCSWGPDDTITPEQEQRLMDDFERTAFAGLEPDRYNILWVRHIHAGHHELHFVIPRIELSTGRAMNAFPPGWQKDFDPLRDLYNHREGWSRPDDPARARTRSPEHADLHRARLLRWGKNPQPEQRAEVKDAVHEYLLSKIQSGDVINNSGITAALEAAGLTINRVGKDYITVKDPVSGEKLRLKGGIYARQWQLDRREPVQPDRASQSPDGRRATDDRKADQKIIRELECELDRIREKRTQYNRKRYRARNPEHQTEHHRTSQAAEQWLHETLAGHRPVGLGPDAGNVHRRPGIDEVGAISHHLPILGNERLDAADKQSGEQSSASAKPNLGPGIAGGTGGPLHHPAAQRNREIRLDSRPTPGHQTGVKNDDIGTGNAAHGKTARIAPAPARATPNHPEFGKAAERIRAAIAALERAVSTLAAAYRNHQQKVEQIARTIKQHVNSSPRGR